MGWSSWNCWGREVDQAKVAAAADALVRTGLADHGWKYVNIDDGWQGRRDPTTRALLPNEKFPDLPGLACHIHQLGLKLGLYSTPWVRSYAGFTGGSADTLEDALPDSSTDGDGRRFGKHSLLQPDVHQWVQWGVDYLKYDWYPLDLASTRAISKALRSCGRDIVLSLSNSAPLELASDLSRLAECWRTTGDICDLWTTPVDAKAWEHSVTEIGFGQAAWTQFGGPGHWNDADMLVVGHVGWGSQVRATRLTRDEQCSHMSLWCLLGSPLMLGCDLDRLDAFTMGLLTNDEVIEINQDPLGLPAVQVRYDAGVQIWARDLEDGTKAVGLFNLEEEPRVIEVDWHELGVAGPHKVRDLWRSTDGPITEGCLARQTPAHGVSFVRLQKA